MKPINHNKVFTDNRQQGSVLLFALLVMSSVVIGSIGLGSIILDMLQQTKISDDSIIAYYAAESGVEEALYNARETGRIPPSFSQQEPRSLPNGAEWWGEVTGSMEVVYADVGRYGFVELNLFDPDAPTIATDIDHIEIVWENAGSVMRASVASWFPDGQISWEEDAARLQPFELFGGSASLSLGSPSKLYKLRLRAKEDALGNVTVRAYDSSNNQVPIPGQVRIDMNGDFVNSERRLIAKMPRGAPLSRIFDYVVFSECSLVKGGRPISCP